MSRDRDLGIPLEPHRDDGGASKAARREVHREVGELLLRVDELEDTLRVLEQRPVRAGESRTEVVRAIEERIRRERDRIAALERRGAIDYDEVERAMRLADTMG